MSYSGLGMAKKPYWSDDDCNDFMSQKFQQLTFLGPMVSDFDWESNLGHIQVHGG